MNVQVLPSTINTDEAVQLMGLLAVAGIEGHESGVSDIVLFQSVDDVPRRYSDPRPWGVLVGKSTMHCDISPERAEHWISVFRQAPFFIAADRSAWNYSAGWLVQSGRIPRGDEILLLHPSAISTLPQRLSGWSPEAPAFELPRGLVSARPARFATAVAGERQLQMGDSLSVSLRIPEPNLVSVAFLMRSHGSAPCRVAVGLAGYTSNELVLSADGSIQWQRVLLPTRLQQLPGETFELELSVVSGSVVMGTADFAAALFLRRDQQWYPAVRFEPGNESALQRFRFLARRAVALLRQGDWRRFWYALKRRILGA